MQNKMINDETLNAACVTAPLGLEHCKEHWGRKKEVACTIEDKENGQYEVRYGAEAPGFVKIFVQLYDEVTDTCHPIAGSPFTASFSESENKPRANEYLGPTVYAKVVKNCAELELLHQEIVRVVIVFKWI